MKFAKKSDFLIIFLIIAAAVWMIFQNTSQSEGTRFVEIYEGNVLIERRPLDGAEAADGVIELEHAAIEISDGGVFFKHSDCPDKVCMHAGRISKSGQMLACVPNGLVVQIVDVEPSEKLSANITGYFDTVSRLVTNGLSEDEFRDIYSSLSSYLNNYHNLYNIYYPSDEGTNMHDINIAEDGALLELDPDLFDMLRYSRTMYDLTNGKVNIYLGDLIEMWQRAFEEGVPPSTDELQAAADLANPDAVYMNYAENGLMVRRNGRGKLNVGSIAKGYALDKVAAEIEKKLNGQSALIAMGGNIRAVGGDEDWKVGIQHPRSSDVLATFILPYGRTVATSGDYERYFVYEGVRYHHIIDPGTLLPAKSVVTKQNIKNLNDKRLIKILNNSYNPSEETVTVERDDKENDVSIVSVTVLADSGALADALTTALFIMPIEDGVKLAENQGAEVLYILSDLKIIATPGFPEITIINTSQN